MKTQLLRWGIYASTLWVAEFSSVAATNAVLQKAPPPASNAAPVKSATATVSNAVPPAKPAIAVTNSVAVKPAATNAVKPAVTTTNVPTVAAKPAAVATNAAAAKPAAPALPAQVAAPYIASIFPAGGQRGKTVMVTLTGKNLLNITTVGITGHGVTAKIVGTNKTDSVQLAVTIAPDADMKERDIRVITAGGPSNRWRFMIGDLPELNEIEPNNDLATATGLTNLPVLVNGQAMMGDRDYFRFTAKAGQTIVLAAQARAILTYLADAVPGWCDICLTLFDDKGKAIQYVDDYRFKPDPIMIFKVQKDGTYYVCVHDIMFRGRGDFVYRLTVGAVPYITDMFPMGGQKGTTVKVALRGVNLPVQSLDLAIPADSLPVREFSLPGPPRSNLVPYAAGDVKEVMEVEPNDTTNQATRVQLPVNINGRINRPGDQDYYVFQAEAGQRLVFEVFARRLDSPVDTIMTLIDARGNELAENDDVVDDMEALITHHADSKLTYTFRQKGDYYVRIRDTQGYGGDEYAYRLWIGPERPGFALRITPDNPRVGKGETVLLNVDALRKDGFTNEITVSVKDLPKGFTASQAVISGSRSQVPLTITAPPDAELGVISPTVVGTAMLAGQPIERKAFPAEAVMQAFFFTYQLPTHDLLLAVLEATPFRVFPQLKADEELELKPGGELTIQVKVARSESAKTGFISLGLQRPPTGITAQSVPIQPEENEGKLVITASKSIQPGRYSIIVSGTLSGVARYGLVRIAPAIAIRVVPEVKLETKK
ncbi:MAG: PPC domain-containing protein [Verrucomicrobiota bacterium]